MGLEIVPDDVEETAMVVSTEFTERNQMLCRKSIKHNSECQDYRLYPKYICIPKGVTVVRIALVGKMGLHIVPHDIEETAMAVSAEVTTKTSVLLKISHV